MDGAELETTTKKKELDLTKIVWWCFVLNVLKDFWLHFLRTTIRMEIGDQIISDLKKRKHYIWNT